MKKRRIYRFGNLLALAGLVVMLLTPLVAAQSTDITVWVGPLPVDVCPNISGVQVAVPSGMIIDGNGDCVTPTPPPVDVCANIAGVQTTIPAGYYQDSGGNCLIQPVPPVDVCPNLYGTQITVPSSLIVDSNGNCVTPPIDECPNIPGPQPLVPDGMIVQDGNCLTPPGTVSPPPSPPATPAPEYSPSTPASTTPAPGGYRGPDYKNVPPALNPIVDPIVKAIPKEIRKILQEVPPVVAQTVPYYIIGVLGGMAGMVTYQAFREIFAARALIILLKRDKNIANQKDNFIALASHYLRTPLTLMRNGLDTIIALKELPATTVEPLRTTVSTLDGNIKTVLEDIENNAALKGIHTPDVTLTRPNILRSGFFWGPIISAVLLTWLANFLLGVVGNIELGGSNMLFQALCLIAVIFVLYSALRNHHIRRVQREKQQKLIENEHAVDDARNAFIQRSTAVLQQGLNDLSAFRPTIATAPSARFFDEGYQRFAEILQKFLLLSQIKTGAASTKDRLHLKTVVDTVLEELRPRSDEKKLTITNDIDPSIYLEQNRMLFTFVIYSLIDNAIKFNSENGSVVVSANPSHHTIRISVADNGIGIPEDKLSQLFKPFSRAGSAIEFNYEGLGFSLFLDKIITDYMGGSIKAAAPEKGGAAVTVTTTMAKA